MKIQKISNCVLYVISAIIVLSFLAYFFIGYDNMEGDKNAPVLTGYLLFVQYALVAITFVLMVWSLVVNSLNSSAKEQLASTGVPGTKITLFTWSLLILAMIVGAVIGFVDPANAGGFTTSSGSYTSEGMLVLVDVCMWSMYILAGVSVIAVVISATGILNRK